MGISLYGEFAKGGVMMITTKSDSLKIEDESNKNSEAKSLDESKVLVLVDGKEIPKED